MKKVLGIGLLLAVLIYALPVICAWLEVEEPLPIPQDKVAADAENTDLNAKDGQLSAAGRITVQDGQEVREMELETYVADVVAGEISPDFPVEAIRAQAVAARTYAVYKREAGRPAQHPDAYVCTDPAHCAAFVDLAVQASARWGESAEANRSAIEQAVQDTAGQIVTYDKKPIIAVFSAAAGERTETAADVWGSEIPYLQSVESPGGESCPKYHGTVTLTADEVRERAAQTFPAADLTGDPAEWFKASERSEAGGIITVKFGGVRVQGTALRTMLGLHSTNFTVSVQDNRLTFTTVGYGHGVGLSQWGARYLAEQGKSWRQILAHYYPGTEITSLEV